MSCLLIKSSCETSDKKIDYWSCSSIYQFEQKEEGEMSEKEFFSFGLGGGLPGLREAMEEEKEVKRKVKEKSLRQLRICMVIFIPVVTVIFTIIALFDNNLAGYSMASIWFFIGLSLLMAFPGVMRRAGDRAMENYLKREAKKEKGE